MDDFNLAVAGDELILFAALDEVNDALGQCALYAILRSSYINICTDLAHTLTPLRS